VPTLLLFLLFSLWCSFSIFLFSSLTRRRVWERELLGDLALDSRCDGGGRSMRLFALFDVFGCLFIIYFR
jgi:hypothetical protein